MPVSLKLFKDIREQQELHDDIGDNCFKDAKTETRGQP
jgi:hypothetical protein